MTPRIQIRSVTPWAKFLGSQVSKSVHSDRDLYVERLRKNTDTSLLGHRYCCCPNTRQDSCFIGHSLVLFIRVLVFFKISLHHVERCFKQTSHVLYQSLVLRTLSKVLTSYRAGVCIGPLSTKLKFVGNILGQRDNINTKKAVAQNFEVRKNHHKSTKTSKKCAWILFFKCYLFIFYCSKLITEKYQNKAKSD
jgi:hypothetical protein